jgi:hypothetical protein
MVLAIQELIVKASKDLVPRAKEVTIKQDNGFRIDYKVNTQGGAFEIQDNTTNSKTFAKTKIITVDAFIEPKLIMVALNLFINR